MSTSGLRKIPVTAVPDGNTIVRPGGEKVNLAEVPGEEMFSPCYSILGMPLGLNKAITFFVFGPLRRLRGVRKAVNLETGPVQ
jgi:hypothetical protein